MEQQGEEDDLDVLYMGGVQDPTGGLAESKRGRGADVRRLKRVRCYLGSTQCRKLSTVVSLLRDEPREIARSLTGRVQRSCAFAADVGTFPGAPPLPDGWRIGPISPEAVLAPEVSPDESAP